MRIGVPKESIEGERRVALIPDTVKALTGADLDVDGRVRRRRRGRPPRLPVHRGRRRPSERDAWGADIVAAGRHADRRGDRQLGAGKVLIGFLAPLTASETTKALASGGVTSFAVEAIPRITRAQAMDALSSQANVAGYAARCSPPARPAASSR